MDRVGGCCSTATSHIYLEILEPLDAEGVKHVMNLFKEKLGEKSIFCITQRGEEFNDLFHSRIDFRLNGQFTEIV